jgi:hypothetical protein
VGSLHYGTSAHYNYFTGCSKGGSEAATELQRYPAEFDGIVGGAAAFNKQLEPWPARRKEEDCREAERTLNTFSAVPGRDNGRAHDLCCRRGR